jgi:hypothetical protein
MHGGSCACSWRTEMGSIALHNEVNLLLPWYVNGTLSETDREKVQAHLDVCGDCREELSLCAEMMDSVRQQEATPIIPATTAAQVLNDAQEHVSRKTRKNRQQRWAIAAAIGFVALLLVVGLTPSSLTDIENQRFETATSAVAPETMDYVLELRFVDSVSSEDRAAIIDELGGGNSVLTREQTNIRIVLSMLPKSLNELEQHASEIAARREIESAEFVALQLPVK